MKTTIKNLKMIEWYDGFVSGTFDTEDASFFIFMLAYDVNSTHKRIYGAFEVEKGDESQTIKERVENDKVMYIVDSEPDITPDIITQDIDMIEMTEEQRSKAVEVELVDNDSTYVEMAVEEEAIKFWLL